MIDLKRGLTPRAGIRSQQTNRFVLIRSLAQTLIEQEEDFPRWLARELIDLDASGEKLSAKIFAAAVGSL